MEDFEKPKSYEVVVQMSCKSYSEVPAQYPVCAARRAPWGGILSVDAVQVDQDRRRTRDAQSHAYAAPDTSEERGVAGDRRFTKMARMSPRSSSRDLRVFLFLGLLYLCAAALLWIHSSQGVAATLRKARATDAMGQTIVIHADRNLGVSRLRQGFVHGISYEKGKDYSRTIALIS